jgi:hypoxanthine-DNA glycosylase
LPLPGTLAASASKMRRQTSVGQRVTTEAGGARARSLRGFAPVIDRKVETLILGSFPSAASLAHRQYYAHPRNQFWPILGTVLGEPLAQLPYDERLRRVLASRIGIWDVYAACQREGSLDSAIRRPRVNDLQHLCEQAPKLARVLFNGRAAGRFAQVFSAAGFMVAILPSTSPAFASLTLAQKMAAWRRAVWPAAETAN